MNFGSAVTASLPTLPVVPHHRVEIDGTERRRIESLARKLLADEPSLGATEPFGPGVRVGLGPWPALVIEDHSWIALFGFRGDIAYSYRAMLFAGEGDQVVIGAPRSPDFERYCRSTLGLGEPEILIPRGQEQHEALAVRCANDQALIGKATSRARAGGGLNVVAYMGTGGVWHLAQRIAARAGVEIRVAAPPPNLTRRVNDKLWFACRVADLLGRRALPRTSAVFGFAALAGRLAQLAKRSAAVAVKLPDSASSAGNVVFDSTDVAGLSMSALRDRAKDMLKMAGWSGGYPLMVTEWEQPVLSSPSVQLWIPELELGDVVVEGIFDQTVMGEAALFCGAIPTRLSKAWQRRLCDEAARLGLLFQLLGYFGRCSFDSILIGGDEADAELHWIECNGRWGGTSIPMTLANRLVGDWGHRPFVIIESGGLKGPPASFASVVEEMGADLFVRGGRPSGAVFLSPSRIETGTGYELMVIDESVEAALASAQSIAARRTTWNSCGAGELGESSLSRRLCPR